MKLNELNDVDYLTESVADKIKIVVEGFLKKSVKFDKATMFSNVNGFQNFQLSKSGINMTLSFGDDNVEHPMTKVIVSNFVKDEIKVTIPETVNKKSLSFLKNIITKIVKKLDEDVKGDEGYKKFVCSNTDTSIKVGRVGVQTDKEDNEDEDNSKGANRVIKAGGKATIFTGKRFTINPKVKNPTEEKEEEK